MFHADLRLLTRNEPFDLFMSRDFDKAEPVRLLLDADAYHFSLVRLL